MLNFLFRLSAYFKLFSGQRKTQVQVPVPPDGYDYWERLQELQLYSQERRRERYMVIFLWKLSQGLVKGYEVTFTNQQGRRGRTIVPSSVLRNSPAAVRKARESSLGVKGARIFNLLPASLRDLNSKHVDTFKSNLDAYLSKVPDQPTVGGRVRAAESNSLLHQIPMMVATNVGT